MRLLSMLTIPMSLCSARLQVFVFIAAAVFSAAQAPWVLFGLYLASFVSVVVTALLFRGRFASREPFVIELPPWRLPTRPPGVAARLDGGVAFPASAPRASSSRA